jgi:hypothetical protein
VGLCLAYDLVCDLALRPWIDLPMDECLGFNGRCTWFGGLRRLVGGENRFHSMVDDFPYPQRSYLGDPMIGGLYGSAWAKVRLKDRMINEFNRNAAWLMVRIMTSFTF